ncbi:MAG: penicillin-binding transpeptidase domain-containing protein, partial [Cellulomonas sp.]
PMSAGAAAALRQMMIGVVDSGTGGAAKIPGVVVAAKTGTAQTVPGAAPHAWFTAFAPADGSTPKVAVAVVVEHGGNLGNEATGGQVAAPIAAAVIKAVLGK